MSSGDTSGVMSERAMREAATDPYHMRDRSALAKYASTVFAEAGERLHVVGHIFETDRHDGASPLEHGSDEAVGVSALLRIAAQLISASADLLVDGRPYAGAALLRQLVEVEYLAWAFETRDSDAERWLRSDKKIREDFFRPAKLREAAQGKFRGKDYGYHCELGGHPVPQGTILLHGDNAIAQLLLSDLLGHVGRIWDHLIRWALSHEEYGQPLLVHASGMSEKFRAWKKNDPLTELPPP